MKELCAFSILLLVTLGLASEMKAARTTSELSELDLASVRAGDGACQEAVPDASQYCGKCREDVGTGYFIKCTSSDFGSACTPVSPTIYDCWVTGMPCGGTAEYYLRRVNGLCVDYTEPFGPEVPNPLCDFGVSVGDMFDNCSICE